MTLFQNYNYGATLQAYSLQRVIRELGYDVETIQYQRTAINTNTCNYFGKFFDKAVNFIRFLVRIVLSLSAAHIPINQSGIRKQLFDEFINSKMKN